MPLTESFCQFWLLKNSFWYCFPGLRWILNDISGLHLNETIQKPNYYDQFILPDLGFYRNWCESGLVGSHQVILSQQDSRWNIRYHTEVRPDGRRYPTEFFISMKPRGSKGARRFSFHPRWRFWVKWSFKSFYRNSKSTNMNLIKYRFVRFLWRWAFKSISFNMLFRSLDTTWEIEMNLLKYDFVGCDWK